jgi:hypothetical protein
MATGERAPLAAQFFAAARALACSTGTLQERLADAYADHLLTVTVQDLPADLQPAFRELEEQLNNAAPSASDTDDDDDPFQAAAAALSDSQARASIERILLLYGRLAGSSSRSE